jgi:hypothetical protein
VAEQIVGLPVDDLVPRQEQEIARLEMLVEAAGRLLGTLDLDAVLADVLRLAQSTLDADAYALWRRDPREDVWSVSPGSSQARRLRGQGVCGARWVRGRCRRGAARRE